MKGPITRSKLPLAVASVAALFLVALVSCNRRTTTFGNGSRDERQTDQLLSASLDMLQPDRLGISAQLDSARTRMNDWRAAAEKAQPLPESGAEQAEVRSLLEGSVSPDALKRLAADQFDDRDLRHVRNCLLYRKATQFVLDTAGRDLERASEADLARAVELFYYVVRNVALVESEDDALPLPPFRVLLFGRGTAEDRAWIFADLLRQLRIDVVVLRPRSRTGAGDQPSRWLIGALLHERGPTGAEKKVYLFDPRLGLPIPSPEDDGKTVLIERPATLQESLENPAVLDRLDADEFRYPLQAANLKELQVEVVGHTSLWAPRMRRLQMSLSGDQSAIVYDPLQDTDIGAGALTRVAEFGDGHWNRGDIAVWPYPERALEQSEHPDEDDVRRMNELVAPFDAPVPFAHDPNTKQLVRDPQTGEIQLLRAEREQLKARIAQLLGDYGNSVKSYVMRLGDPQGPEVPAAVNRVHAQAAEDASFWIGVCQMERIDRDFAAAVDTFSGYLSKYGRQGKWGQQAEFLRAVSFARDGKPANAVLRLQQIPATHPQAHGHALLIERWRNLRKSS